MSRSQINNIQPPIANRSAFTLVELIVAISLASILILVTALIFKQASSAFSESDARNEVYQNARAAFDMLKRDISGAALNANYELFKALNDVSASSYSTIGAKEGSDILVLLTSAPNLEDKPVALITYFLDTNNILNKAEITGTDTLNSSIVSFDPNDATGNKLGLNVSTLQFRYYDNDAVGGDTWDSTTKKYLPDAVEVKMTISDTLNRFTETFTSRISMPR